MDAESGLRCQAAAGVLTITLDRPAKMNALRLQDMAAIDAALRQAADDPEVRCIVLTGAGKAFSAGRDLSQAAAGEGAAEILRDHINPVIQALHDHPRPTIAAVNGAAMGIGLGLALACDVVLAGASARFSSPFAKLGAALDSGGHAFLQRRLPRGRALELIYTGRVVNGAEAVALGLADRLVPDEVLAASATALGMRIAAGPSVALQAQKALFDRAGGLTLAEVLDAEAELQGRLSETHDYAEGLAAFAARRPPVFNRAPEPAE